MIPFSEIDSGREYGHTNGTLKKWWDKVPVGKAIKHIHPKGNFFSYYKVDPGQPINTVGGAKEKASQMMHHKFPRYLNDEEITLASSFPLDYKTKNSLYVCAMSVPPVMMANISNRIYRDSLSVL